MFRYETTFVFNNDFPALLEDVPEPEDTGDPLFKCVCFFFSRVIIILNLVAKVKKQLSQVCRSTRDMQGDVFQPQVQRDPAPDEPTGDQGGHRHLGGGDDHLGPEVQVGGLLLLLQMFSIKFGRIIFNLACVVNTCL